MSRSNKSHDRYQPSPFPSTFARRSLSPLVCSFVDRLSRFPHLLYTSVRVNFCAKRTSEVRDASAQRVRDFNPEQPTTEPAYHPTNVNLPLRLILLPSYNRVDVFADSFDRSDCCNCIIRRRRLDILPEKFATRAGMLNWLEQCSRVWRKPFGILGISWQPEYGSYITGTLIPQNFEGDRCTWISRGDVSLLVDVYYLHDRKKTPNTPSCRATNGELFLKYSRGYYVLETCQRKFVTDATIIQQLVSFEMYTVHRRTGQLSRLLFLRRHWTCLQRTESHSRLKTCQNIRLFCDSTAIQRLVLYETYIKKLGTWSDQKLAKLPSSFLRTLERNLKFDTFLRVFVVYSKRCSLSKGISDLQRHFKSSHRLYENQRFARRWTSSCKSFWASYFDWDGNETRWTNLPSLLRYERILRALVSR